MSLGIEIVMAVAGLWAVFLRPLMIRYAAEMIEVMGYAVHRILTGTLLPFSFLIFLIPAPIHFFISTKNKGLLPTSYSSQVHFRFRKKMAKEQNKRNPFRYFISRAKIHMYR